MMTLAQAHAMLPGSTLVGDGAAVIARVHSDTRTLRAGDLFVALKGERFDGHDMLAAARDKGAVAAIAQRGLAAAGLPGLQVADSQQALERIAAAWRARFALPLIAVTGSNGKTTVTQMIAAILRAWLGDAALATEGNYNNHIGVPLTLLRLRQDDSAWHRAAVVELGMNHPGEIALLAAHRAADHRAGQQRAARAPGIHGQRRGRRARERRRDPGPGRGGHRGLPGRRRACAAVAPLRGHAAAADLRTAGRGRRHRRRAVGQRPEPASIGPLVLHTPAGSCALALRLAGRHNVKNALAAAACALAAGAPLTAIKRGLEAFVPVKGRSQLKSASLHGVRIALVDDSYNANPDSMRAAIDVLAAMRPPRLLLLGDMGEVGARGAEFHAEVGAYARECGIEQLWCAGPQCAHAARAFGGPARHFGDVPALIAARSELPAAASVLVKGSRFMAMERVVQALTSGEDA